MTVLSAHQPVYLPGIILFNKIALSDTFVFLADVQFKRRSWHVRNQIRNGEAPIWLSVSVDKDAGQSNTIRQVAFGDDGWIRKHCASLEHTYRKRPYFDAYYPALKALLEARHANLAELNMAIIRHVCAVLDLETKLVDSADLDHGGENQARLISLCHAAGADRYISNVGSAAYIDEAGFAASGVSHLWQAFTPPVYDQGKAFLSNLSIIDALFNLGPATAALVRESGHATADLAEAQAAIAR